MIAKCFVVITLFSVIFSVFSGNFSELTTAMVDGAAKSVSLSLEMCGMACLWCGVMQVFMDSGILNFFCKLLTPILSKIFPGVWKNEIGKREIVSCIGANILGIGNAATPYALAAMRELDKTNRHPTITTDDMAAFTILGTSSFNLLPTTLITLRQAAGSLSPYSIIAPIWVSSFTCAFLALLTAKLCAKLNHTPR